jgi:hypothetical protein
LSVAPPDRQLSKAGSSTDSARLAAVGVRVDLSLDGFEAPLVAGAMEARARQVFGREVHLVRLAVGRGSIDHAALFRVGGHRPIFVVAGVPVAVAALAELLVDAIALDRVEQGDIVGLVLSGSYYVLVGYIRHPLGELERQAAEIEVSALVHAPALSRFALRTSASRAGSSRTRLAAARKLALRLRGIQNAICVRPAFSLRCRIAAIRSASVRIRPSNTLNAGSAALLYLRKQGCVNGVGKLRRRLREVRQD